MRLVKCIFTSSMSAVAVAAVVSVALAVRCPPFQIPPSSPSSSSEVLVHLASANSIPNPDTVSRRTFRRGQRLLLCQEALPHLTTSETRKRSADCATLCHCNRVGIARSKSFNHRSRRPSIYDHDPSPSSLKKHTPARTTK